MLSEFTNCNHFFSLKILQLCRSLFYMELYLIDTFKDKYLIILLCIVKIVYFLLLGCYLSLHRIYLSLQRIYLNLFLVNSFDIFSYFFAIFFIFFQLMIFTSSLQVLNYFIQIFDDIFIVIFLSSQVLLRLICMIFHQTL